MNREELAWAAGLFDGEGYVGFLLKERGIYIHITQTDRQVLDRFRGAVFNLGNVTGPYQRSKKNWKPYYQFQTNAFEPSQAIIAALYPFLSPVKKAQSLKALKEYNDWYPTVSHKSGRPKIGG